MVGPSVCYYDILTLGVERLGRELPLRDTVGVMLEPHKMT